MASFKPDYAHELRRSTVEAPSCQETHNSCQCFFRFFSRLWVPGVVSRRRRVLTCLLCTGATERGGTTPVLRCARRRGDERRDQGVRCARDISRFPPPVLVKGGAQRLDVGQ